MEESELHGAGAEDAERQDPFSEIDNLFRLLRSLEEDEVQDAARLVKNGLTRLTRLVRMTKNPIWRLRPI